jgi:hypothetical protein
MDGDQTVQMRALVRAQTIDGAFKPRQVFWTTPVRAQHYIENRIAEYIAPAVLPQEQPMGGPQEIKKSFLVEPDGPLTDSAESTESGKGEPLSAAPADQVLPQNKPVLSTRQFRKAKRKR